MYLSFTVTELPTVFSKLQDETVKLKGSTDDHCINIWCKNHNTSSLLIRAVHYCSFRATSRLCARSRVCVYVRVCKGSVRCRGEGGIGNSQA